MLALAACLNVVLVLSFEYVERSDDTAHAVDLGLRSHVDLKYYDSQLDCRDVGPSPSPPSQSIRHDLGHVHVVYSCDQPGFTGLLRSMISLTRHLEFPGDCTIHIIVAKKDVLGARSLVDRFYQVLEVPSRPLIKLHELLSLDVVAGNVEQTNVHMFRPELVKPFTFVPFYLHKYFAHESRIIWLDVDTIVKDDIGSLYRMPLQHALAAAPEAKTLPTLGAVDVVARETIGVRLPIRRRNRNQLYLNIGVMLLDLDKLRSMQSIEEKLENRTRRLFGFLFAQLAFNIEFQGRIEVLDWRWNVLGLGYWPFPLPELCERHARILHWHGPHKYWHSNRSWFMKFNDRLAIV